ncbi:hypothetical protein MKW92_020491, partial [Papaver armeniacum]
MDYTSLRLILEDLKRFKFNTPHHHSHPHNQHHHHHHGGIATLYRSFSGLVVARSVPSITTSKSINGTTTSTNNGHHHHHHNNHHHGIFHHEEEPVILVQSMRGHHHHDLELGVLPVNQNHHHEKYETKFLMSNEEGGEYEVAFFKTLDEEFNAVNKFYRDKVDEVMNEAAVLTKQMDALVAFRVKVEHPDQGKFEQLCKEIARSASAFSVSSPKGDSSSTENSVTGHMEVIQESNETSTRGSSVGEIEPSNDDDVEQEKHNEEDDEGEEKPLKIIIPAHLELLSTVKINSPSGTPRSTIKGILKKKRKNNLKQLQSAFVHFYHKLQLLKSFSYLNLLAFSKTMKKYDKVILIVLTENASKIYLHMVDNSYIGSSDDVTRLMDRVEASFIKHFSKSNRSEGMNILRSKKERKTCLFSHRISLLICLILVINLRNVINKDGFTQDMETINSYCLNFPGAALFGFLVFHMLLYAAAIYFWKLDLINYPFIFGFKQGTELGYREVFLLSTILATAALACVLANLDMELDISTKKYKASLNYFLCISFILIIVCPFNIVYRSSRIFLLRTTFRAISAPLYRVTLSDFMLADQLSSQERDHCKADVVYNSFYIALAAFPFWLRFTVFSTIFQEKDVMQGINGFKYLSIVLSVSMVTAYRKDLQWDLYV